ncbi:hypothetical protein HMPREF0372_03370 [Flavonifractor plautii ATCC 29863]|jgi:hypothetical protein|uniref:Uncharacterized protein n=1 Tax=Flavonifractor plautii ATCC 29863 TaxID=411475 RepID=G9YV05_FLAPL|nr:hypothetical protein HMPREF0372_03370 [Flavonifractor plautii ATCC 29863]
MSPPSARKRADFNMGNAVSTFLHNIDKMSRRIIGRFYGCMCGKGERSTANSQEGQRILAEV